MLCVDRPCEQEGCGAGPVLRRCCHCGIAGLVTGCAHSERFAPIDISLTVDWPKMTCDLCERRQEEIGGLVEGLLGGVHSEVDLTCFRRAVNAALSRPWLMERSFGRDQVTHAVRYVWNEGDWRDRVAALLEPPC
jgi:hypothetical protein